MPAGRKDGQVVSNPNRSLVDPNHYPVLPYQKVHVPSYLSRTILGTRTISYHSSQGCPFTCSFCAVTKTYWGRWLPEKVDRTLQGRHRPVWRREGPIQPQPEP